MINFRVSEVQSIAIAWPEIAADLDRLRPSPDAIAVAGLRYGGVAVIPQTEVVHCLKHAGRVRPDARFRIERTAARFVEVKRVR